jgi:hypothetical protein
MASSRSQRARVEAENSAERGGEPRWPLGGKPRWPLRRFRRRSPSSEDEPRWQAREARGRELKRRTAPSAEEILDGPSEESLDGPSGDAGVDRRRQRTTLDGMPEKPRGNELKRRTARSAEECLDGHSGSGTTGAASSSRVLPRWRGSVVPTTQELRDGGTQAVQEEEAARGGEA